MHGIANKLGWALAGIISLLVVGAAATIVQGGPLDPTAPPGSTMKTLEQIEPRTPISTIPITISQPGSYYLTRNLTATTGGAGITISSNNVTLDLNGFTLDGAGLGSDGVSAGGNVHGLKVHNGNAQNWTQRGFYMQGPFSIVLQDIQARGNAIGIQATNAELSRCAASFNTQKGIVAVFSNVSDCNAIVNPIGIELQGSTLRNCRVESSTDTGIYVQDSTVESCQVEANRWGMVVTRSSNVHHNTVSNSGSDGIRVTQSGTSTIADNNVSYSGASGPAHGIWVESSGNRIVRNNVINGFNAGGIGVSGNFNTIDDNSALLNVGNGIAISGEKNTIIRNSSLGNDPPGATPVTNYYIEPGNNPAPIVAAEFATNPMSNTQ